ncbi:MAG: lysozyme inhibitor LprI family protein [Pseudomonadota bacterium]
MGRALTWAALMAAVTGAQVPNPVAAQAVVYDPAHTTACLTNAPRPDTRHACIGRAAERCMENTPGGQSTVGIVACLDAERQWWDARLNAAYADARTHAARMDVANQLPTGVTPTPTLLRDMQRTWITFRDQKCGYEVALWGPGTGAGPAGVRCLMITTAEQAIFLEITR